MRFALILDDAIVMAMATLPHATLARCLSCEETSCVDSSEFDVRGCYCAKELSEPNGTCVVGN
jgi:hypothetical protein